METFSTPIRNDSSDSSAIFASETKPGRNKASSTNNNNNNNNNAAAGGGGGGNGRCYSESHHRHRTPGQILSLTSTLAFSVVKRKRPTDVSNGSNAGSGAFATPSQFNAAAAAGSNRSFSDSGEISFTRSNKEKQVMPCAVCVFAQVCQLS